MLEISPSARLDYHLRKFKKLISQTLLTLIGNQMTVEVIGVSWMSPLRSMNFNKVSASQWIRMLQLVAPLRDMGVASVINDLSRGSDVFVFNRWQDAEAQQLARDLRSQGKKIVVDLVVDYFSVSETKWGQPVTQSHVGDCLRMVEMADAITVASSAIQKSASEHHGNVSYIPDSINLQHFYGRKVHDENSESELRLFWAGAAPKFDELLPLLPIISDLNLELVVSTSDFFQTKKKLLKSGVKHKLHRWSYERFPEQILGGDVAISYRDTLSSYNRGHSSFKIMAPMSMGLPAVASPLESYREATMTGGGYIASDDHAWHNILEELSRNRSLLSSAGAKAAEISEGFSTDAVAKMHRKLFRSLLD